MTIREKLKMLPICREASDWLDDQPDKPLYQIWRACPRGDWLLWLAVKLSIDRKLAVLAICDCAEHVLQYVPADESRSRAVIETARAWCGGTATIEQVWAAAYAAETAAAYAVAYVVDVVATAAAAAAVYAADAVVYAADAYAAEAGAAYAREQFLAHSAKLVRRSIPWKIWKDALENYNDDAND